jgi:hypothetical protein
MKTMNMPDAAQAGSALVEFLAGRLGAPECWPNDNIIQPAVNRVRKHLTCDAYGHVRPTTAVHLKNITTKY